MNMCCRALLASALMLTLCAKATESDSTTIHVNPLESLLWHTVTSETFTVAWELPDGATTATLSVEGYAYSATYSDLTDTTLEVSVPVATNSSGENVYEFTLTFDDDTVQTAHLATITGISDGGAPATTRIKSDTSARWDNFAGHVAVPLLPGTSAYSLNSVADSSVDGHAGWRLLRYEAGTRSYTLDMTSDDVQYSVALTGSSGGFTFIVR